MDHIQHGYLEVILGPMFSGKTSKLVEIYKQYTFCDIPVMVINHQEDQRYSNSSMVTHDQVEIACIQSDSLVSVINENLSLFQGKPFAILINEGQFFPDLYKAVYDMVFTYKMHVFVAGLDGDYQQNKFGDMLDLIPICDKVYKLQSLCVNCKNGTKAIFSHRINKDNHEQKMVGASESYIPICRKCNYNENYS